VRGKSWSTRIVSASGEGPHPESKIEMAGVSAYRGCDAIEFELNELMADI